MLLNDATTVNSAYMHRWCI